jgi:CHAT domain-containing protein
MLFARAGKQQADAQTDSQFVAVVNPDGSLIFAEGEVEKIPTNLAGEHTVAYGADARLEWLLDKATQADYLHLSTHGDFASGWPERSALLLAHPEGYTEPLRQAGLKGAHLSRAELQDSCKALTLNDLWAYRLKVKPGCLVVLSACETGQIEPGDMIDEALGFPTALLAAGARGVVASLWAVDDFSTSLLMQKMYEEVASGKPPAAAMQVASKYLRNLDLDQIHKEVEGQIQKLEEDYKSGRWKELSLSDQARMFYRITTLKIIFQRTQNHNLKFSKSYYWAPFLYYHLL